ncbi:MAG: hypothetical protein KBT32_11090 [Bacteroidales bacterium]|nr:hypothetical protein [Candidatus Physcocola equi]
MKKGKLTLILLVAAVALHLIKAFDTPFNLIFIFGTMAIAAAFNMILPTRMSWELDADELDNINGINGLSTNNMEDLTEDHAKAYSKYRIFEVSLFMSITVLMVGAMFKAQRWPGASPMLLVGSITVVASSLAILLLVKPHNCTYSKMITKVAIASIVFTAIMGTGKYISAIRSFRFKDYPHYVEVISSGTTSPNEKAIEFEKVAALSANDYNRLDATHAKALELAQKDKDSKVIYILVNMIDKSGGLVKNTVFDAEYLWGAPSPLEEYASEKISLFTNPDIKFYVVSNNPQEAKELLAQKSVEGKEIIIVE